MEKILVLHSSPKMVDSTVNTTALLLTVSHTCYRLLLTYTRSQVLFKTFHGMIFGTLNMETD